MSTCVKCLFIFVFCKIFNEINNDCCLKLVNLIKIWSFMISSQAVIISFIFGSLELANHSSNLKQ